MTSKTNILRLLRRKCLFPPACKEKRIIFKNLYTPTSIKMTTIDLNAYRRNSKNLKRKQFVVLCTGVLRINVIILSNDQSIVVAIFLFFLIVVCMFLFLICVFQFLVLFDVYIHQIVFEFLR